jgi:hypothetical protein
MSGELARLKAALDQWIAEDPNERRFTRLTPKHISDILGRAEQMRDQRTQQGLESFYPARKDAQ